MLEKMIGMKIDVQQLKKSKVNKRTGNSVPYKVDITNTNIVFKVDQKHHGKNVKHNT